MLAELRQLANGYDHMGERVDRETQISAINQYQQIQEQKGRRFIEQARQESDAQLTAARAEAERKRAETEAEVERKRAETEAEVARRRVGVEEDRLRLDALQASEQLKLDTLSVVERLKIEKAEVLVKALQVAVDGGVDPNHLLAAIQGLGDRLLPGPTDALQIEDRGEEDA